MLTPSRAPLSPADPLMRLACVAALFNALLAADARIDPRWLRWPTAGRPLIELPPAVSYG